MKELIKDLFEKLDKIIRDENLNRREDGVKIIPRASVLILGQMSLLMDEVVSAKISLAQTGDMDAKIEMDHFVKEHLKTLLIENGFIYDEDSEMIFIPEGSRELTLFEFENIVVKRLDPESVLVSKALRAPEKKRQLLIEGIASELFPNLINRIKQGGGDLDAILEGDDNE